MNHHYFLNVVGDVEAASGFVLLCKNEFEFANLVCKEFFEPALIKKDSENNEQFEKRRKIELKYFKQKAKYFADDIYKNQ